MGEKGREEGKRREGGKQRGSSHAFYFSNLTALQPLVFFDSVFTSFVPMIKTDFGRRAFSSAAPQIWNHISTAIRVSPSLDSFKRHLKAHYFASP